MRFDKFSPSEDFVAHRLPLNIWSLHFVSLPACIVLLRKSGTRKGAGESLAFTGILAYAALSPSLHFVSFRLLLRNLTIATPIRYNSLRET